MKNKEQIIVKNGKELRCGFTTGSCATAASKAGVAMLLSKNKGNKETKYVEITIPDGRSIEFTIINIKYTNEMTDAGEKVKSVSCSVIKDGGDDPDVTDGMEISATCVLCAEGIHILGGKGVGVAESKGLSMEPGQPAINPVPKAMIESNVKKVFEKFGYKNGVEITIFAPCGEEIAKKTFNERLGIKGGISIIGTTGVVEPMSEKALVDTLKLMIDKEKKKDSCNLLVSLGNYGMDYCKNTLSLNMENAIKCSNFIGEVLDYCVYKDYKSILLVGHLGKMVKLAGGVMNTHSKVADCRMEILAAHLGMVGSTNELIKKIMSCSVTDEALTILEEENIKEQVINSVLQKILFHIDYRVQKKLKVEVIVFAKDNPLAMSDGALGLLEKFKI